MIIMNISRQHKEYLYNQTRKFPILEYTIKHGVFSKRENQNLRMKTADKQEGQESGS